MVILLNGQKAEAKLLKILLFVAFLSLKETMTTDNVYFFLF